MSEREIAAAVGDFTALKISGAEHAFLRGGSPLYLIRVTL